MPASVASAPVATRPTSDHATDREVRQHPAAEPADERAEVEPGRPGVASAPTRGATRASATSAPTSRIGYSQTPGKTSGATSATNAEASAPPVASTR